MIVAELIAELQKHPPDMLVLVDGNDVGYDDVRVKQGTVKRLDYEPYVIGRYEDLWGEPEEGSMSAVILERKR